MSVFRELCCKGSKRGWILLMDLGFLLSAAVGLTGVDQPPVVAAALGQDAVLPCHLWTSSDEKIEGTPVLYWSDEDKQYLLESGRAQRLDQNPDSLNKSVVLKNVRWSDSKKYECKLSVKTEKKGNFRTKGNQTTLLIYDSVVFSRHNDSLLGCQVNVTQDPAFVLSIIHDGCKLQGVEPEAGERLFGQNQTVVRLSQTTFPRGGGEYECQLHLGGDLLTKSVLFMDRSEDGEAEKTSSTCSSFLSGSDQNPEPWFLYSALLAVPILVLLVLVAALLMRR